MHAQSPARSAVRVLFCTCLDWSTMGNSKLWRFSGQMPTSIQAAVLIVSLILVLCSVSYQMLPTNSWGNNFNNLLLGVSWGSTSILNNTQFDSAGNTSITAVAPVVDNLYYPPQQQAPVDFSFFVPAVAPSVDLSVSEDPGDAPLPHIETTLPGNGSKSAGPEISNTASLVAPAPSVTGKDDREKFMVPVLTWRVGAGNQFMEYINAAVIARSLNRTLCLTPFFPGPSRHVGTNRSRGFRAFTREGTVHPGLAWEDRFEVSSLSRFTRVASLKRCFRECAYTLDDIWMLKSSREPIIEQWKRYPSLNVSLNLKWDYVKWTRTEDITAALGERNERCVGMYGLFPGLRWRGAFLAVSAFLQPAPRIVELADALQKSALGKSTPYLAVHWRFEESECGAHNIGLCFVRCEDGSVIDTGLPSEAKEWHDAAKTQCNRDGHFRGVTLDKIDILDAIQERAGKHNVSTIYFATDGWMRGPQGVRLVKETVEGLRQRGLTVVGLWKVPGLYNFNDSKFFDPVETFGPKNQDLSGAQIALVEQELCSRADSFMGSGQSTWSLSVFRVRLARRRVKQIVEAAERDRSVDLKDRKAVDRLISDTLLKDLHPAGLHCRYLRFMKRYRVNETVETNADEYPDGWLDLEACEGRIGRGGRCVVAQCF